MEAYAVIASMASSAFALWDSQAKNAKPMKMTVLHFHVVMGDLAMMELPATPATAHQVLLEALVRRIWMIASLHHATMERA